MAHLARPEIPRCQLLFQLFGSPRGAVSLGRIGSGAEAGRIVVLRELSEANLPQVAPAVELAKNLAHPQLLKLLGVVSDDARSYIASEYIPGVSLSELVAQARARQRGMEAGAAVRVIMDALAATATARKLLLEAGVPAARLLHGECIWLVDYGATLLAEAGVSALLSAGAAPTTPTDPRDVEARDMMTAAIELYQLASARLMTGDLTRAAKLHLPSRLARLLEGVFTWAPSEGFDGVDGMANALSELPPALVGSESLVASELQRLCADLLDERRSKLSALHDGSGTDVEGPTRLYAIAPSKIEEDADEPTLARPGFASSSALEPPETPSSSADPVEVSRGRRSSSRSRPRSSVFASAPGRALSDFVMRERSLVAFFALLALLVAVAWRRPAWFRNVAARLGASPTTPARHDRGERPTRR